MENSRRQAAQLTISFVKQAILGHERVLFQLKYSNAEPETMDDVNLNKLTLKIENLIGLGTVSYFNQIYDSLVVRDDPYVNKIFDQYRVLLDHSPVCLIQILFRFCLQTHLGLVREKFVNWGKLEGLEEYAASVAAQLNIFLGKETEDLIQKAFDHPCAGEKVAPPLPAGKRMFYAAPPGEITGKAPIEIVSVRRKRCAVCGKDSSLKCSRCLTSRYCSQDCQKTDWKVHKQVCGSK
jgi:hypothetical protein